MALDSWLGMDLRPANVEAFIRDFYARIDGIISEHYQKRKPHSPKVNADGLEAEVREEIIELTDKAFQSIRLQGKRSLAVAVKNTLDDYVANAVALIKSPDQHKNYCFHDYNILPAAAGAIVTPIAWGMFLHLAKYGSLNPDDKLFPLTLASMILSVPVGWNFGKLANKAYRFIFSDKSSFARFTETLEGYQRKRDDIIKSVIKSYDPSYRRIIVFDLENVLIKTNDNPILNPQAEQVLQMARQDFDEVYLWTFSDESKARPILERYDLLKYFDKLMYNESKETRQSVARGYAKDLSVLGNPTEFVLLDDDAKPPLPCYPRERIVNVEPFNGQEDHDLMKFYKQALEMFEKVKN